MAKTYTAVTVANATAGNAILASDHSTNFQNVNNLIVPAAVSIDAGAQNIATATNTYLSFGASATYDTDSMYSSGTPTYITINTTGLYLLTYYVLFSNATTGTRFAAFVKNLSTVYGGVGMNANTTNPNPTEFTSAATVSLAATDKVYLRLYHTQGTNVSCYGTMTATWIGRTS